MTYFKLNAEELDIVETCLFRCASEASRQIEKGALENCSGFAWYATKQCLSKIRALLDRIDSAKKKTDDR